MNLGSPPWESTLPFFWWDYKPCVGGLKPSYFIGFCGGINMQPRKHPIEKEIYRPSSSIIVFRVSFPRSSLFLWLPVIGL